MKNFEIAIQITKIIIAIMGLVLIIRELQDIIYWLQIIAVK